VKCPGCGAEFNSKDELIDHVVERHDTTCQMCELNSTPKKN
jgi:uncharacterized C2H2 Zn-finger protein